MSISMTMRDPAFLHARMAELFGRLSLAFDIANDSPYGKAVRSVVLAVELGKLAGANAEQLRDTYWLSLFAYLGRSQLPMCDTSIRLAQIVGAGPRIASALGELCERWDGRGVPSGLSGEALSLPI